MKDEKKKIKEPYEPKDTPQPPQIIEPNSGRERENPVEANSRPSNQQERAPEKKEKEKQERPHLMSEDADIDDETTI